MDTKAQNAPITVHGTGSMGQAPANKVQVRCSQEEQRTGEGPPGAGTQPREACPPLKNSVWVSERRPLRAVDLSHRAWYSNGTGSPEGLVFVLRMLN